MPTSIPYHPALVLGNIVDASHIQAVKAIAQEQAKMDAAETAMNNLIELKRSLDMTAQELMGMSIDPGDLVKQSGEVGKRIVAAAVDMAKTRMEGMPKVQEMEGAIPEVNSSLESPLDYNRTEIKSMPLSVDSFKLNAQYFSFDEEKQSTASTLASIKNFITASVSYEGTGGSGDVSEAVTTQINGQLENHDISGTLIVAASCTHKNALLLAPLILDVDKAIRIWNLLYRDRPIDTGSIANIQAISREQGSKDEQALFVLSGATYGSSFVGMVHVLNKTSTRSAQAMYSAAASMQAAFEVGNWYANASGGFGVDESFAADVKHLLSMQNITSHINIITMGAIPSIVANDVELAVKQFADFSPDAMMGKLATMANATSSEQQSVASAAEAARTKGTIAAIRNAEISSVLTGVKQIQDGSNKMLDINSMMTALDDYIKKATEGGIGVPINYYVKPITRLELAEMWMAKYYPNKYLAIAGDDSQQAAGSAAK